MKIIYFKKNIHIQSNNTSSYNTILQCLQILNIPKTEINNYYLTSLEGHPLQYSTITSTNKTYHLKKRLKGSALMQAGNSGPLITFTSITFAVISIIYYWIYLNLIIGKVHPAVKARLSAFSVTNMKKHQYKNLTGGDPNPSKFKEIMTKIGNWITNTFEDKNVGVYFCYTRGMDPGFAVKEDEGSFSSILSSAIFYIYMFVLIISLFCNIATSASCGNPKKGFMGLAFVFLAIPLIIAIFIPLITSGLDFIMNKFGKPEIFSKFKLLTSNTILLILLIFYMISNRKGISSAMWLLLIPAIIVFGIFQFKFGSYSIDSILSNLSRIISNQIFVTNTYSKVPNYPNGIKSRPYNKNFNPIPNNENERNKLPLHNIRECFDRFEFFFFILKASIFSIIAFGFMSIIFASQVRTACPIK